MDHRRSGVYIDDIQAKFATINKIYWGIAARYAVCDRRFLFLFWILFKPLFAHRRVKAVEILDEESIPQKNPHLSLIWCFNDLVKLNLPNKVLLLTGSSAVTGVDRDDREEPATVQKFQQSWSKHLHFPGKVRDSILSLDSKIEWIRQSEWKHSQHIIEKNTKQLDDLHGIVGWSQNKTHWSMISFFKRNFFFNTSVKAARAGEHGKKAFLLLPEEIEI